MAMCSFADRFSMFDVTPVENLFIEEYMLRAPGDYVSISTACGCAIIR